MKEIPRREFIKLSSKTAGLIFLPFNFTNISTFNTMKDNNSFDIIIIGGSYAGLAAAMALGRALMKVLLIDDGNPCNRETPHSHNFLTNDGKTPAEIAALAKLQVSSYDSIKFFKGTAVKGKKTGKGFEIGVASGEAFAARQLIFATGIKDILPGIEGLAACWGISVLHCPYCHGYEVRNEQTGVLGNGDMGYDFSRLISNWTKDLTLFTNGRSTLTTVQREKLQQRQVNIVENEFESLDHDNGYLQNIVFKDGSRTSVKALYAPTPFEQHCEIPASLGCGLTEEGYIKTDEFYETGIKGVFAVGDNASKMRTVANAVAMGTAAGMTISKRMILESF